jgi:HAD superfamily hydrolase (TIGR01509 family)
MKAIAFDCDGVLFDTADSNRAYYNALRQQMGMPVMTEEQFAYAHMNTVADTLAYLFPGKDLLAKAHALKKNTSYNPFVKAMKMEPGLMPLLKKLRPAYKTAIATNRSDSMPTLLREHNIRPFFDCIISANDVTRPKPYPDQLVKLLDFFGIESDQMLYVGDSIVDQQAADAAGVALVAYDNPSLSAAYHIKSLKEIEEILGL